MRPTGKLHIGHYFGALQNWVRLQNDPAYECFYFIADWHALTSDYADTSAVAQNTIEIVTDYLAAGLDPQKSVIFQQSLVPEHAELHLLLGMVTPLSWLERVPTYKEAFENVTNKDLHTYGFLGYPCLQTADIVLYSEPGTPLFVPVGEDQVSHVELSREIVRRFNFLNGFTVDERLREKVPLERTLLERIASVLRDPELNLQPKAFPLTDEAWVLDMAQREKAVEEAHPGASWSAGHPGRAENKHIGSTVESLFEELGETDAVGDGAAKKIISEQMRRLLTRIVQSEQAVFQLGACAAAATGYGGDLEVGANGWSQAYEDVRALRLAAEGLAARTGITLGDEIAKHRSRGAASVQQDEIGELWGMHVKVLSESARELAYRFLALSFQKRVEIAQLIGIQLENAKSERECSRAIFQAAKAKTLLSRLWEEIEKAHGADATVTNPYAGR